MIPPVHGIALSTIAALHILDSSGCKPYPPKTIASFFIQLWGHTPITNCQSG